MMSGLSFVPSLSWIQSSQIGMTDKFAKQMFYHFLPVCALTRDSLITRRPQTIQYPHKNIQVKHFGAYARLSSSMCLAKCGYDY